MSWNYRVVAHDFYDLVEKKVRLGYGIKEVYYDKEGNIEGWTANYVGPSGWHTFDDLKGTVEKYQEAFNKPILYEYNDWLHLTPPANISADDDD